MGDRTRREGTRLRIVIGALTGLATVGAASFVLTHDPAQRGASSTTGLGRWILLSLAVAAGLFVAAGVLRLAKWRVAQDQHSAWIGIALLVMGGLYLPVGGITRLFVELDHAVPVSAITRAAISAFVIAFVLRSLASEDGRRRARPAWVLSATFSLVTLLFWSLLNIEKVISSPGYGHLILALVLSGLIASGWMSVAARVAREGERLPWARRAAPLFLGLAMAEFLRMLDIGGTHGWTLAGVLVCVLVAGLATRSAMLDLDAGLETAEHQRGELFVALHELNHDAQELTAWREQLTHDARNACAGLRAAMEILERHGGRVDPSIVDRLRVAALQEIGHIEHLLSRTSDVPCEEFEVGEVVGAVAAAASSLGARVSVQGEPARAIGRAADFAAVLKNILVNAQTHAPGSQVDLTVDVTGATVGITCSDDGPGLSHADTSRLFERGYRASTRSGSGLGLYTARQLMREQGGDVQLVESGCGATFLITLPAAQVAVAPRKVLRVPAQRARSPISGFAAREVTEGAR